MKRFEALGLFVAIAALAGCGSGTTPATGSAPAARPIQHIVIMMQENRSFDNVFAGFPGADTTLEGACLPAPWCKGSHMIKLHSVLLESYKGGAKIGKDLDHSHRGFGIECNANKANVCQNDGFDLINFGESGQSAPARTYPYAYIDRKESAPYWTLAKQYTLADKMFFTETASSFIAHQSILAGTVEISSDSSLTDQPNNTPWGCDGPGPHNNNQHDQYTWTPLLFKDGRYKVDGMFPCFSQYATMADLLDAKNFSWKFYVDSFKAGPDFDFSGAVWDGFDAIKKVACPTGHLSPSGGKYFCNRGRDWKNVSIPNTSFFSAISSGTLPSVSWVIPSLHDSDHPASGCNGGPWWVTKVVNAVGTSKYWKNTAIILIWDDWGGWYDNVPPDQITYTRLGFRVPMVVISPFAKPGAISHTQYDTGSILRFVEENFGLGSLGTTDASSTSIGDIFNYRQKPNKFVPAREPPVLNCGKIHTGPASMQEIIREDGGIPE
ncbi:MAG TPA: alkaline phosphatase family protein [Candidatus Cybelea sp.]|jgi:phospholipase C|nr:alkaline phosphatase family protein [Candidatus Cybelea sp.]